MILSIYVTILRQEKEPKLSTLALLVLSHALQVYKSFGRPRPESRLARGADASVHRGMPPRRSLDKNRRNSDYTRRRVTRVSPRLENRRNSDYTRSCEAWTRGLGEGPNGSPSCDFWPELGLGARATSVAKSANPTSASARPEIPTRARLLICPTVAISTMQAPIEPRSVSYIVTICEPSKGLYEEREPSKGLYEVGFDIVIHKVCRTSI